MTSSFRTLTFNVDADGIALVSVDLHARSLNVLTPQLTQDLAAAVERVATDNSIRGVIVTSGKSGCFIAGADVKDLVLAFDSGITARQGVELTAGLCGPLRRLETCGKPVACALNGTALGGGLEVALACHWRVLADDAVVGLPEVGLGLLPGGGGTQRLPRLIGIAKATPLLLRGQPVKAAEALKLGVVNAVAPAGEVVAAARAWLLDNPTAVQPWDQKGYRVPGGVGPLAPHAAMTFIAGTALVARETQHNITAPLAILSCLYEGTQVPFDVGMRIEAKYFGQLLASPVARNMMRTLFVNKNAADKLVRRPEGVPSSAVRKVGVLGAGMMGSGIAYVSAAAGIEVVLLDTSLQAAERGKNHAAQLVQKATTRGKLTQARADALLARIRPTQEYADLAGCDLVVEAVFESRAVKADVTRQADAVLSSTAVFASNTSTLPITGLAKTFSRPSDFIGLHFFSPVDKMPLVEVIKGAETSDATLARALDYVAQLKKTPVVVNDSPGFFTSRVFGTYIQEGALMLEEGIAPALIENAARQAGFPVGPLAVSDEVTLELQLKAIEQNIADGQPVTPALERVLGVLRRMVQEQGRIGKRGAGGYYDYPAAGSTGRKALWPGLSRLWPLQPEQPGVEEVKMRLLYIQAVEALRCMEENVLEHPADADLGSVLGIGFPAWTGGVASFADTVGLGTFVAQAQHLAERHGERFAPSAWLKQRGAAGRALHPKMSSMNSLEKMNEQA